MLLFIYCRNHYNGPRYEDDIAQSIAIDKHPGLIVQTYGVTRDDGIAGGSSLVPFACGMPFAVGLVFG